ncbi:MAG: 1-deoxy-D-xylulose-5-phosphate reductoisomerase [SAR324 cluster bacterium]|nr:1-deoxy-D-xylulose-5-phosphate reductoisomerase [SAR324 cluster bacterium]
MTLQKIAILGSTGSIGQSSLDVIRINPELFQVVALGANSSLKALSEQIAEFQPLLVSVGEGKTSELEALLPAGNKTKILEGMEGLKAVATIVEADQVIAAMVGAIGIEPVLAAIDAKKRIALANKETIVLAGPLVMERARKMGVKIFPVDSEHNAIFQALNGENIKEVDFITLTASGGPFRDLPLAEFENITLAQALKHPNWDMGPKITIDSASLMNKALEVIEAKWLFDLDLEQIKVVVHKESIIHSLVTFKDGSSIAQLGQPDMRVPISYCLAWPKRVQSGVKALDLAKAGTLHFAEPDLERFPTLDLAFRTLKLGGGSTGALSGGNEELVALFLAGKLKFTDIFENLIALVDELEALHQAKQPTFPFVLHDVSDALQADQWGRDFIKQRWT